MGLNTFAELRFKFYFYFQRKNRSFPTNVFVTISKYYLDIQYTQSILNFQVISFEFFLFYLCLDFQILESCPCRATINIGNDDINTHIMHKTNAYIIKYKNTPIHYLRKISTHPIPYISHKHSHPTHTHMELISTGRNWWCMLETTCYSNS